MCFLEKDLKVRQQRISIQNKSDKLKTYKRIDDKYKSYQDRHSSHFIGQNQDKVCCICDGRDHVETNGPNGSKLIQYFACKEFAEMTSNERFLTLKRKGYCIQCLFLGKPKTENFEDLRTLLTFWDELFPNYFFQLFTVHHFGPPSRYRPTFADDIHSANVYVCTCVRV